MWSDLRVGIDFLEYVAELLFESFLLFADHSAQELFFQPLLCHGKVNQGDLTKFEQVNSHNGGGAFLLGGGWGRGDTFDMRATVSAFLLETTL